MNNIRKDSKVSAHTNNNVLVIGTVAAVRGSHIIVTTPSGVDHDVLKAGATKLTAAEFKVQVLEATQPKAKVKVAKKVATKSTKPNKKADALKIFVDNVGAKRKEVIKQFMAAGLSAAGASTYYQNFKSGTWATS